MSTLTSTSTDAQVEAAYDDNASYAEDLSESKCRAFVTACRFLIRRLADSMARGANSLHYDRGMIQKELERAQEWLLVHTTTSGDIPGPRVTRSDFRNCR